MSTLQLAARNPFVRVAKPALKWLAERWPWPVRARLTEGPTVYVDLRSAIGRGILVRGEFDPAVFVPIRQALEQGGNFLDVGANVGYYSVLAAHLLGSRGRVHAFEIDPRPIRCLHRNSRLAGAGAIVVHEVAIGRAPGYARLHPGRDSGHTRATAANSEAGVRMTSIDEWRRESGVRDIRAIKIDIEGGEFAALQGARQTLVEERPTIVFEMLENAFELGGGSRAEIVAFLESNGYQVVVLSGALSPTLVAMPWARPTTFPQRSAAGAREA